MEEKQLFSFEGFDINYLEHYGIKGQRWGVRRYQNADGTLTAKGRERYNGKKLRDDPMSKEVRDYYTKNVLAEQGQKDSLRTHKTLAMVHDFFAARDIISGLAAVSLGAVVTAFTGAAAPVVAGLATTPVTAIASAYEINKARHNRMTVKALKDA